MTFGELVQLDELPKEIEEMYENEEWSKPYTDIDELFSDLFEEDNVKYKTSPEWENRLDNFFKD